VALGWADGRNLRMDVRWAVGNVDRARTIAKVDLQPDAILAHATPVTGAFQRETRTIPIVFVSVTDPLGAGFVASLPRPGGNLTGFIFAEAAMAGKFVELLTEIAPGVKRAAIVFNPDTAPGGGSYFLPSFEAAARSPQGGADHSSSSVMKFASSEARKSAALATSPGKNEIKPNCATVTTGFCGHPTASHRRRSCL